MHTKKELDSKLTEAGVTPLKKLGQNFLVNPLICQKIIQEASRIKPATIIEIGPGLGALTDDLLKLPGEMVLIELDSGLVKYWEAQKNQRGIDYKIIHGDALQLDWNSLEIKKPACLVSNLPYSIAASLVMDMSSMDLGMENMILMFQKEVAERLQAQVNDEDYGMLSVVAQSFWTITKLIDAGPQDFHPVPNVGSRVLGFSKIHGVSLGKEFISFVKQAFSQRRKKMISNLGGSFEKDRLAKVFESQGLSQDTRAQELSASQFQSLFNEL